MKYAFCVAAAAIFNVGSAHAEVVNISALAGANPVSIDLGGGATGVGETLDLTVGTYTVTLSIRPSGELRSMLPIGSAMLICQPKVGIGTTFTKLAARRQYK